MANIQRLFEAYENVCCTRKSIELILSRIETKIRDGPNRVNELKKRLNEYEINVKSACDFVSSSEAHNYVDDIEKILENLRKSEEAYKSLYENIMIETEKCAINR